MTSRRRVSLSKTSSRMIHRRGWKRWVGGVAHRVIGGGTPAGANGAEVNVAVEVVGGQEAIGDVVDEVVWERGPVWLRHVD